MADTNQKRSEEKKDNKAIIIIIILILLIIVFGLVAVIVYLLGRNGNSPQDNAASTEPTRQVQTSTRLIVDEESAESVMEQMRKEVEEGMFECKMSMKWSFEDGESESKDAYVANSENNKFPIYFDIYLDGSNELIYSSPVLPVGSEIKNIKLDKDLPAGTYEATVMYTLIRDEESQEVVSSAGFVITITVDN